MDMLLYVRINIGEAGYEWPTAVAAAVASFVCTMWRGLTQFIVGKEAVCIPWLFPLLRWHLDLGAAIHLHSIEAINMASLNQTHNAAMRNCVHKHVGDKFTIVCAFNSIYIWTQ